MAACTTAISGTIQLDGGAYAIVRLEIGMIRIAAVLLSFLCLWLSIFY